MHAQLTPEQVVNKHLPMNLLHLPPEYNNCNQSQLKDSERNGPRKVLDNYSNGLLWDIVPRDN